MTYSVLLDTSFLIHFFNKDANLHQNAQDYFKYFQDHSIKIVVSAIAAWEYCVKGKIDDIITPQFQSIDFRMRHAKEAGLFTKILEHKKELKEHELWDRTCVKNDTLLFTQAHVSKNIKYFVTADKKCQKKYTILQNKIKLDFEILDIHISYNVKFDISNSTDLF